jgi:hypothetical protein
MGNYGICRLFKELFEAKKRALTAQPTEATIPYPPSLFTTYHVKRKVKSVKEGFEKSRYSHTIFVHLLILDYVHT